MAPYAHWDIPVIGQSYLLFRARLAAPFEFSAGEESLETRLFDLADIPFSEVIPLGRPTADFCMQQLLHAALKCSQCAAK
jgi:hypothetical protein